VRPDHLEIGTVADNNADRDQKGRTVAGRTTKLTEMQVGEIRQRWVAGGVTQAGLASTFGVSRSAVAQIVRGETWRGL
jgi:DNA-binding transcriptional regulator YiaG